MTEISPTIVWACVGIALIILEVFTTTFFLLFFGIAGLLTALTRIAGVDHLPTEIIIFSVIGILGTLSFRSKITASMRSTAEVNIDHGQIITLTQDIAVGATGKIKYRGSPWKAINESEYDLKAGDTAIIDRVDGIKLILKQN